MRETMWRQPADLRRLLADPDPVERAAERLAGRRLFLVGTGTSWHAANHGAWFLRAGGVEAWPVAGADAALYGLPVGLETAHDALLLLSHRNSKTRTATAWEAAGRAGIARVAVTGVGAGGEIETVENERSAAFTASHTGALLRLAQLAELLGARLGDLAAVPDAVAAALDGPGPAVAPPDRLLELTGAGANQWTAAEGSLKTRETAYLATEGLDVEALLHGPGVALGRRDALVALDGGGPGRERLSAVAAAAEKVGVRVHRVRADELGEPLSVFALTVAVQRVALECAEALGTDPDSFGLDRPGRDEAWGTLSL